MDNGKIFYEKTNFPEQYIIHDWVAIGPGLGLCDVQLGSDFNMLETLPEQLLAMAIEIGHFWSWAGFMATQFWAINFAKNTAIHSVSAGFYQVATR